jgi:hypothetical protein
MFVVLCTHSSYVILYFCSLEIIVVGSQLEMTIFISFGSILLFEVKHILLPLKNKCPSPLGTLYYTSF